LLTLVDALTLVALTAKGDPPCYGRAAVRWHGRFALEAKRLELAESQLVLAALAALPADEAGSLEILARIARRLRGFGNR
jgi:hypothetical protein